MATRPLENARWSFESNCFVCEPGKGRVCAEARATFTPLGPAQAVDAIGAELTAEDARYVRGRDGG